MEFRVEELAPCRKRVTVVVPAEQVREEMVARKEPPGYDRFCRELSAEQIAANLAAGKPFVIRFRAPLEGETVVRDLLRGDMVFQNVNLEDLVLLKSDGYPTYHLANVVDDHAMEITHILRGAEWIPTAPLHVLPQLWFRNTWSWGHDSTRPNLRAVGNLAIESEHRHLGKRWWYATERTRPGAPPAGPAPRAPRPAPRSAVVVPSRGGRRAPVGRGRVRRPATRGAAPAPGRRAARRDQRDPARRDRAGTGDAMNENPANADAHVDLDVAVSVLAGPLFYRRLVSREVIDPRYAEQLVDHFLRGAWAV